MSDTQRALFFSRHFRRRIENNILSGTLQMGHNTLEYHFENYTVHLVTRIAPMESAIAGQKKIYLTVIAVVEAKPNYPKGLVHGEETHVSVSADVFSDGAVPKVLREKVMEVLDGLYDWLEEKGFTEPLASFEEGAFQFAENKIVELETVPCLVTEEGAIDPHFQPKEPGEAKNDSGLTLVV